MLQVLSQSGTPSSRTRFSLSVITTLPTALVLKKDEDAYFSKDFVQKIENTAPGKIKGILQAIVFLFSPNNTTLAILDNDRFKKLLEQLVDLIMPSISLVNSFVQKEIDQISKIICRFFFVEV